MRLTLPVLKRAFAAWLRTPTLPISFLAGLLGLGANKYHHEPLSLMGLLYLALSSLSFILEFRAALRAEPGRGPAIPPMKKPSRGGLE